MKAFKSNRFGFVFLGFVFLFFLLFYAKLYPLVISTTDDYFSIANHRQILPEWHGSEPARVFPEVFMPLVSQGSASLFRVFGGNILGWLTFGRAFFLAAVITGLAAAVYALFRRSGVPVLQTCAGLAIFLLMHFWIFKQKRQDGNIYMLWTDCACTCFHYVIPNLMNAILVLWLHMDRDLHELFKPGKALKKAFFVFYAYLCIFSNIWGSMILASYLGVNLVVDLVSGIRRKTGFREWMRGHYVLLLLTAVWVVAQVFEMSGSRAAAVGGNIGESLGQVWATMMRTFRTVNLRYLLFCGQVVLGGLISFIVRKDRKSLALIGKLALALLLTVVYLLLSCAKTGAGYAARPDVFYGAFFFGAVMVMLCLFELLRRFPAGKLILPLLILFILVDCNSMGRTWRDSINGESVESNNRINQDILDQLQQAEAAGLKETVLYIPKYESPGNMPYNTDAGEQIAKCFYKFGALKEKIVITEMVPDPQKNMELGISP